METKTFEFAADLDTPVSAFLKLAPLQPVFLLESVERNETVGRYSFLGIMPKKFLVLNNGEATQTFFKELEDCLQELRPLAAARFSAGLVGYFSYELAGQLHPKLNLRPGPDPLAAFVLPSAILMFDHLKRRILFSSILPDSEQVSLAKEIRTCLQTLLPLPRPGRSSEPVSALTRGDFCAMVERAGEHIKAGNIFQVVLSTQFEGETAASPFQMYRALRMINPSPYMFYLNFPGLVQFFGSSPETMVRTEGSRLLLRPIAGTRRRGLTSAEDEQLERELLQDDKEKAEHLMLLDLARNDLGRISKSGTVKVKDFMKVERYSHVMHLVSTVEGEADPAPGLKELFSAVFPAGTVSGAPKIRAMQIIEELEPHQRGLYAGSVGYFSANGEVDHCISIRCLLRKEDRYIFTAGAGIVADSRPEAEYEEILNKAMALRTMLKMVEAPL